MILEKEIYKQSDEFGGGFNIEVEKNPLFNKNSIKNYVKSYKVNRDGEIYLLFHCGNRINGCQGRGWVEGIAPNGLKYTQSCYCVDKTLVKLGLIKE